jgi:hypothetical protein
MEEARQHSALNGLYWLSTLLVAASAVLFVLAFLVALPISGDTFAILMFIALATRGAFFFALARARRSLKNSAWKVAAFQCVVWTAMGAAFFVFVVLYQIRNGL